MGLSVCMPVVSCDSDNASKSLDHDDFKQHCLPTSIFDPQHEAAAKLQKVYKSFRTRRSLADCTVIGCLDFAELKHSSISFFHNDKHETAVSRWSRALTRASKVGKGLSKNGKARKLALQHWLEAIDPGHRYGHNLHFYYVNWLNSQCKEPFFYWLDIGEGKDVNIVEKCTRSKLQQQCIKYLSPMERKAYEIVIEDGKLFNKETEELLDTPKEAEGTKWIFVLSASNDLYVGEKKKGSFHHSSFLAGGATLAAGRIVAEKGVLKAAWPHSGHYRPTPENFQDFLSFLRENNVDVTDVKLVPTDEDREDSSGKKAIVYSRSNSSDDMLAEKDRNDTKPDFEIPNPSHLCKKLTPLEIPTIETVFENSPLMPENQINEYKTALESFKRNDEEIIAEEHILPSNYSHNANLRSFRLGKQLLCKQCTGVGPRIGCLRAYTSGLQCHALQQLNLSPRSDEHGLRLEFRCRASTRATSSTNQFRARSSSCDITIHSSQWLMLRQATFG